MAELETLMQSLRRRVESKWNESSEPVDYAAEQRKIDLVRRLRCLPRVPSHWRSLVRPPIIAAIGAWQWGDGNLMLLGDTGCGKTLGAAVLAKRLLTEVATDRDWRRARLLVFVDAAQLAIAREQHGLGQGEAPLVQRCLSTPLLFLDELGYLDKDNGVIGQVIDARSKAGLPMIVMSGMQPRDLVGRYGSATARKLMTEQTKATVVQVFEAR
jgi:hypothetical protein